MLSNPVGVDFQSMENVVRSVKYPIQRARRGVLLIHYDAERQKN